MFKYITCRLDDKCHFAWYAKALPARTALFRVLATLVDGEAFSGLSFGFPGPLIYGDEFENVFGSLGSGWCAARHYQYFEIRIRNIIKSDCRFGIYVKLCAIQIFPTEIDKDFPVRPEIRGITNIEPPELDYSALYVVWRKGVGPSPPTIFCHIYGTFLA